MMNPSWRSMDDWKQWWAGATSRGLLEDSTALWLRTWTTKDGLPISSALRAEIYSRLAGALSDADGRSHLVRALTNLDKLEGTVVPPADSTAAAPPFDPQAALDVILGRAGYVLGRLEPVAYPEAVESARAVIALDAHLRAGGRPPAAWAEAHVRGPAGPPRPFPDVTKVAGTSDPSVAWSYLNDLARSMPGPYRQALDAGLASLSSLALSGRLPQAWAEGHEKARPPAPDPEPDEALEKAKVAVGREKITDSPEGNVRLAAFRLIEQAIFLRKLAAAIKAT